MEEVGATLGETQRFECQVIGFPTPTIRWFKDERDITDNQRYHVDYEQATTSRQLSWGPICKISYDLS